MSRDTSVLSGKWGWLWQEDVQASITLAKQLGMRGLLVKAGDGSDYWGSFETAVKAIHDAGLDVAAWMYCYGNDVQGEAKVALRALAVLNVASALPWFYVLWRVEELHRHHKRGDRK